MVLVTPRRRLGRMEAKSTTAATAVLDSLAGTHMTGALLFCDGGSGFGATNGEGGNK
jgi:hypothetical protein